ncbi:MULTISPECIES: glycosyltransferase [unclassified Cryobacterium]|uniref:glycosyltransferase n=1 Tax=unclassified Cryobacterium TaxID=2649013 RepID=UPI001444C4E4|nr:MULTISPECIES: glycosyltransferase [unclassified Cryobacterium]
MTREPREMGGQAESPELVVIASGTSWDDNWLSEKHLALHLSKHVPVLFVDPAVSILTPLKKPALRASTRGPRLRRIGEGLYRLTPLTVPGIGRPGLREVGEWVTRRAIARAVKRLGGARALIVGSLDRVFDSGAAGLKVLYGTDDWTTGGGLMNISTTWLRRREQEQLDAADVVVAVSDQLAERWAAPGRRIVVIPNGCDTEMFANVDSAPLPDEVTLPDPIAGFIGHLSERIDLDMLEKVADAGVSLLLVGPRQLTFDVARVSDLLSRPNVQWIGAQPFERLPSFMRRISVGLTPYTDSEFNRSSDPLKTLEYLAAGRPAVVSDLPSVRRIPSGLVTVATDAADFAAKTLEVIGSRPDPVVVLDRQRFAREQSWAARAEAFLALIGSD